MVPRNTSTRTTSEYVLVPTVYYVRSVPVDGEIYFLPLRPIYSWFYILCVCPKRFCLWQSPIPGRAQQEAQLGQARTGQKRQRPNGAVQPCHIRTVGLLYLGTCTYDWFHSPPCPTRTSMIPSDGLEKKRFSV